MADIKIPFKYCRISRAADFLNCRVEDLLTLGLENKININLMLGSVSSIMIMDIPLTEAEKWRTTLSYSYHLCTSKFGSSQLQRKSLWLRCGHVTMPLSDRGIT